MARSRNPVAKANATGAALRNPARYIGRTDPASAPLGVASPFITGHAITTWAGFTREIPWLTEADRAMVEICAMLRGRLIASGETGEPVGVQALGVLQACLTKLGATPVDRSRIAVTDDAGEPDEFFGAN